MADRKTKAGAESVGFLVILFAICVLVNVIGMIGWNARLDLTEKRLFSLSSGSERLAGSLDDDMEIVAYFTSDLPPPFNATEIDVRNILEEYEAASNGRIHVRFVNPDEDDEREEAERDGVQKVAHQKIENDSAAVVEGYRGIVFKYLGESKVIAVVEDTSGLEYRITTLIKEMVGERRPIGVLAGHDGPTPEKGLSGLRDTLTTYEMREVNATEEIPATGENAIRALLIVEPQTGLTDVELRRINQYVMRGGSLGIFGGGVKLTLEGGAPSASPAGSNVNRLLGRWGMNLHEDIICDQQCGRAPMRSAFGMSVFVPYPPVPIVTFDESQSEHPVLFRLDSAVIPFTSSIGINRQARLGRDTKLTVLARSSEISWPMTGDSIGLEPRHPREWVLPERSQLRRHVLLAALEGRIPNAFGEQAMSSGDDQPSDIEAPANATKRVRVLVAGTSAFLRDEFLPPAQQGQPRDLNSALALGLNAIDWLAQDSDLIAIRAKNVEDPAINVPAAVQAAEREARSAAEQENEAGVREAIDQRKEALDEWDNKKAFYRWANTIGIPLAFAVFGVVRWQIRQRKRATLKL